MDAGGAAQEKDPGPHLLLLHRYYTETKRVNGKPKLVKQVYLGPAEEIYRRLMSAQAPEPLEVEKLAFGGVAALWDQVQELGLREIIDEVVGMRADRQISVGTYLVVGLINRALEPTSKNGIPRWMGRTILPRLVGLPAEAFDSQSFWDAMDLVREEHIAEIEERVWLRVLQRYHVLTDLLLYDTTNFATHIDTFTPCQLPQRGKAKQGSTNQRLVGLALACTSGLGLPFLHQVYEGNRHDARLFPGLMQKIVARYLRLRTEAESVTLVFDKGNNSAPNLEWAAMNKVFCIGSLKPSHYPQFLEVPLSWFKERAGECRLYRTKAMVLERRRVVVVVYNPKTAARQREVFHRKLEAATRELERRFYTDRVGAAKEEALLERYRRYLEEKKLAEYLQLKIKTDKCGLPVLEIKPDKRAIARKERTFGKTILFSDREDWSSERIMKAYNEKYLVEENFRFLKDRHYLRFEPVYHWTDQKIRVHAFMCVLALLVVRLLQYRLWRAGERLSIPLLLEELDDITEVTLLYPGPRVVRKMARLSAVQTRLWELFELAKYQAPG